MRVQWQGGLIGLPVQLHIRAYRAPGVLLLLAGEWVLGDRSRTRRFHYSYGFGRLLVVLSRRCNRCPRVVLPRHARFFRVSF